MNRKTVLVTGSSRGIGKAIAIKYAKEGYNVVINCKTNEELLLKVKKEIEDCQADYAANCQSYGSAPCQTADTAACLAFAGDVGDYEICQKLFTEIKMNFGSLDVLVNNAGISYIGLLTDMKPEEWDIIIRNNLTSVFNCCHLTIPDMVRKQSGKIVNISSVWGVTGASCEVAYSASKGGINAFTKALAKELAPSNIQVNAIACGAIDTEMNHFLSDEELSQLTDEIPAGRLGHVEEIADLVYSITQKNEYLTGQVIQLDGGWI